MKSMRLRILFVLLLAGWALYTTVPTAVYFSMPKDIRNDAEKFSDAVPNGFPKKHIKLGLDLQGGVQLVLGVETSGAVENKLQRVGVEATRWAEENDNVQLEEAYVAKGSGALTLLLPEGQDSGDFKSAFFKEFVGLEQVERDGQKVVLSYSSDQIQKIKQSALEQTERVVRGRVDKWGVAEPVINRRSDGSVLVQLPGFKDPGKAKELLGRTAQLQFKIVDDEFNGLEQLKGQLPEGVTAGNNGGQFALIGEDRDQIVALAKDTIPEDRQLVFQEERIAGGKKSRWTTFVVTAATELTGEDVFDANTAAGGDLDNRPVVSMRFTGPGGKRFADITGRNVKKRMAIILDDIVQSAPVIQTKISGGSAQISMGNGSYQEAIESANELSLILKSGAIPADITVLEERQVGASLGPELANQGIKGILVGLALVLVFMLVYYKRPGLISCAALVLNGLFLLSLMGGFGFAMTLPGIAGFILTLGMAVDANVLINERIRQEVNLGKNAKKAVENAFEKVKWTIIDANVTTLIAALVLLETNSAGPIRGFAVTLMIGLIVSLFTSLFVTKLIFEIVLSGHKSDKAVRAWLGAKDVRTFNFDYLKAGPKVVTVAVLIALGVFGTGLFKGVNWGVDFAGGTEVMVAFSGDTEAKDIRSVAKEAGMGAITVQALEGGKTNYLLRFEAKQEEGAEAHAIEEYQDFKAALETKLADKNPDILQVDFVGPQIGHELRNQGIQSVFWAILGIFVYILLRFDMRFGPGAVVKMFLDVSVMLGFYVFFSRTFDLTSVAAFLTVVGYSVNDTIVIYDRIRENLTENARKSLSENINASINETISRTLNTSLTTVAALVGILIFGSGQIWNFAMAMAVGVVIATISSTFIASSFVLWLEKWQKSRPRKVTAR